MEKKKKKNVQTTQTFQRRENGNLFGLRGVQRGIVGGVLGRIIRPLFFGFGFAFVFLSRLLFSLLLLLLFLLRITRNNITKAKGDNRHCVSFLKSMVCYGRREELLQGRRGTDGRSAGRREGSALSAARVPCCPTWRGSRLRPSLAFPFPGAT